MSFFKDLANIFSVPDTSDPYSEEYDTVVERLMEKKEERMEKAHKLIKESKDK